MGEIIHHLKYPAKDFVTPINYKLPKKGKGFKFHSQLTKGTHTLFHVVLPHLYVPNESSFGNKKPQFIKKLNDNISLTWTFEQQMETEFYFYKVDKNSYDQFKSKGIPVDLVIDPKLKNTIDVTAKKIKEGVEKATPVIECLTSIITSLKNN